MTALCSALCFFCIAPAAAQLPTPDKLQTETTLRLVGGPALHDGMYDAGVEIAMPPGSHTYWKMPGDSGVPPVFDFDRSQNVRRATVRFPAPRRIVEDGLEAFGYLDRVVFPVAVVPADPKRPAVLHADVAYAVCNKICIPAHGTAEVTLRPGGGDGAPDVAAALAQVPAAATPAERADLSIVPEPGAAKPTWRLGWHGKDPVDDVFADAPEGFYFATRKLGPDTWTLVADQTVPTPGAEPTKVTLTLARAAHPLVVEEKLDTQRATR